MDAAAELDASLSMNFLCWRAAAAGRWGRAAKNLAARCAHSRRTSSLRASATLRRCSRKSRTQTLYSSGTKDWTAKIKMAGAAALERRSAAEISMYHVRKLSAIRVDLSSVMWKSRQRKVKANMARASGLLQTKGRRRAIGT